MSVDPKLSWIEDCCLLFDIPGSVADGGSRLCRMVYHNNPAYKMTDLHNLQFSGKYLYRIYLTLCEITVCPSSPSMVPNLKPADAGSRIIAQNVGTIIP